MIGCIHGTTNRIDLYLKRNLHKCLNNLNDNLNELLNNFDVFCNYSLMSTSYIKSGANYNETNGIFRKNISSTSSYNPDALIACCNFGNVKLGNSSDVNGQPKYEHIFSRLMQYLGLGLKVLILCVDE